MSRTFADDRAYAARKLDNLRISRQVFSVGDAERALRSIISGAEAKRLLEPLVKHRVEDIILLDNLSKELWLMTEPIIEKEAT